MRPLKLRLKNFLGVRSGLNRDEIEIDLSGYQGVVAVIGPNGTGKSTLLDNFGSPYRIMPFRSDGHSEKQFSYFEETYGNAEKELIFEHCGNKYRKHLLINGTNKTKSMKAYLFVEIDGQWQPYRAPDGTVSDGLSNNYDAVIHQLIGSPELFFTAIYAAQDRKKLADYAAGDTKMLLSDLLGLDHLLELSAKAGERATAVQLQIDAAQPALREFEAAKAAVEQHQQSLAGATFVHSNANAHKTAARDALGRAQRLLAESQAAALLLDDHRRRRAVAQQQVQAVEREQRDAQTKLGRDLAAAMTHGAAPELVADITSLVSRIQSIGQRLEGLRARLAAIPDAQAAQDSLVLAEAALKSCDSRIEAARGARQAAALPPEHITAAVLRTKRDNLVRQGTDAAGNLAALKKRAELVGRVPCAGMDINSECELLAEARTAQAGVEPLEANVAEQRAAYAELVGEKGVGGKIRAAEALEAAYAATLEPISALEREHAATINPDLARARQRVLAAAGVDELRTSIQQAETDLEAAKADLEVKKQAAAARVREGEDRKLVVQSDYTTASQALETRLAAAQAELAAIPVEDGGSRLAEDERAVQAADRAVVQADERVSAAQRDLARIEAALAAAQAKVAEGSGGIERMAAMTDDMAQWRLLAKALGRDGIVALAIDDAGPSISTIANDLLTACYGPRFSIRFDTQRETKAGTMKETFDMIVFDAERGDQKSVTKLSGGERIWINDAITRAIALFKTQQSGRSFQALFSDESDGGLDDARKIHFMRMKRKVLELGGYQVEYCITHTPELWEMADAVLDIGALRTN